MWLTAWLLGLALICIYELTRRYIARRQRRSPGPWGFPFIGVLPSVGNVGHIHKTFTEWSRYYGKIFQFKLLGRRAVVLRSASVVGRAFDDTDLMDRREPFFQRYVFNDCAFGFASYSKRVPQLRAVFQSALYWDWGRREAGGSITAVIDTGVQRMRRASDDGRQDIDPDSHLRYLLSSLFGHLLIGEVLPADDPDRDALWELINLLYSLLDPAVDGPLRALPFLRFLPFKHGRLFRSTIKARDQVADRYFESQKMTYTEGRTRGLIDVCLKMQADEITERGSTWLTDDYIKGLLYDTVAAGMTEMMKTLRLLILLMCHHQNCQSRVQEEIDDVIGHDGTPSANHRPRMPYTEAVIMEMLRYVSQTPLAIPHKCNKDVVLDGYLIEKDSGIFPNIWGIHHDEDVWGDAWEFRPDRFLTDKNELIPKGHKLMHSFIPFSVGKRRCPGQDFAMSRTFLIFTSLLQQVTFCPPQDQQLPSADPRLYCSKYPLHLPVFSCRVVPRRQAS